MIFYLHSNLYNSKRVKKEQDRANPTKNQADTTKMVNRKTTEDI